MSDARVAIGFVSYDPPQSIKFAHEVCAYLASGYTTREIATGSFLRFHEMSELDYERLIDIAATVYCPRLI
jgi:hypothetical protein